MTGSTIMKKICFKPLQVFYKPRHRRKKHKNQEQFQTLIGILQTFGQEGYCGKAYPFQTLIGILQTLNEDEFKKIAKKFQTLIGILQTRSKSSRSIKSFSGFKPLQVFYKLTRQRLLLIFQYFGFKPLQVFYKHFQRSKRHYFCCSFKPLQVFYKQHCFWLYLSF